MRERKERKAKSGKQKIAQAKHPSQIVRIGGHRLVDDHFSRSEQLGFKKASH